MIGTGTAILGSALIGAGAGIFGSLKASSEQKKASEAALAFQNKVYGDTQNNLAPYRMAGSDALDKLIALRNGSAASGWQDFIKSPDYQFRFGEGMNALENSAAARGGLLSGNALRGITQYGQNFAGNEFSNYWNRLYQQAQLGQSAALGGAQIGANQAGTIGNTIMGVGQAGASGTVGATNAITGSLGSGVNNYLLASYLNKSAYGGGAPTGSINSPLSLAPNSGLGGLY